VKATDSDDSELDSDEERIFQEYKQQQIDTIRNSLPSFGEFGPVDSVDDLAAIIKSTHDLVYVVVHLYQNHIPTCIRLNLSFEALAKDFPHVCFLRVKSTTVSAGFKDAGLPALMIYRGGKCIHEFVALGTELPKKFSDLDVAKFLQSHGILSIPTGGLSDPELNETSNQTGKKPQRVEKRAVVK